MCNEELECCNRSLWGARLGRSWVASAYGLFTSPNITPSCLLLNLSLLRPQGHGTRSNSRLLFGNCERASWPERTHALHIQAMNTSEHGLVPDTRISTCWMHLPLINAWKTKSI